VKFTTLNRYWQMPATWIGCHKDYFIVLLVSLHEQLIAIIDRAAAPGVNVCILDALAPSQICKPWVMIVTVVWICPTVPVDSYSFHLLLVLFLCRISTPWSAKDLASLRQLDRAPKMDQWEVF